LQCMGVGVEDACRSEVAVAPATIVDAGDEFTTSAYASLTYEDAAEADIPVWQWRWLGRILTLRVPCGLVYIGPHWYCSIVMLCFILGVGIFYCCSAAPSGPWQLLGGICVTTLSTVTFLRCALANPGILKPQVAECGIVAEEETVMPGSQGALEPSDEGHQWLMAGAATLATLCSPQAAHTVNSARYA